MNAVVRMSQTPLWAGFSVGAKKMPVVDTSGRFKTKNKKHITKVTKNIQIIQYQTCMLDTRLYCYALHSGQLMRLSVGKQTFEQWLHDNGKLNWQMTGQGDDDTLVQLYGTMPADDYWDNTPQTLHLQDIADYITTHRLNK